MKKQDLKRHLKSYSIFEKRRTTINHAFTSALSVADDYNDKKIDDALTILGQNPDIDLLCAYCNNEAETWDHINALVKNGEFSGFGHQIANLLPCCKRCNSKKGNRDWFSFLESTIQDPTQFKVKKTQIESYIANNSDIRNLIQENCKKELENFNQIKEQVFELFKEADLIASKIRETIKKSKLN